jgi:hypothetical protein
VIENAHDDGALGDEGDQPRPPRYWATSPPTASARG